ncbi:MAG: cytochrome C oxidase subunit I [Candidatus Dadabacteria bacterium]
MPAATPGNLVQNTSYKVVIPFYVYAAASLLVATILLIFSTGSFTEYYFNPRALAITHTMALGWATMIILGASHQLVPVLIEARLYSNFLAYLSFVLAGAGIPLLIYSFFLFQFDWPAQTGAILINAALLSFVINTAVSIKKSRKRNVHATFVLTAACWLLITTLIGLLLVYNFSESILPKDSVKYLPLHAHIGFIGWFLLLVMGVGSRLLPMFLISKYTNSRQLWWIYSLVNAGLAGFIIIFFSPAQALAYFLPVLLIMTALVLFGRYCFKAYKERIRKQVDEPMKVSILSVIMMLLPVLLLLVVLSMLLLSVNNSRLIMAYGFSIFFGWITAMILGMTFKTLPFIVWNKIYHNRAGKGKTPNPKDLFSTPVFSTMSVLYIAGFFLFAIGVLLGISIILSLASVLLFLTAVLYNFNVIKMLFHKPVIK